MKKIALVLISMCLLLSFVHPENLRDGSGVIVILHVSGPIDEPLNGGFPHAPIQPPSVFLDGHTLSVPGSHPDYVVRIVDVEAEDDVVYETQMPSSTSCVVLPSTLSGDYQIQLICANWMFYGLITL
ncbi:MAG: hypothetical protein J5506_03250 [Prevotella sp.]|nr:hypothetical protein [Prevotella sp.]